MRSNGRCVTTSKGTLARELQRSLGDIGFNDEVGRLWGVEVKTEQQNRYNRFFLETWSNLAEREDGTPLLTHGWLSTLRTDLLFYVFQKEKLLYIINFPRLQKWAWLQRRIYAYQERQQQAYEQPNATWGRPVPIADIGREVGYVLLDCRDFCCLERTGPYVKTVEPINFTKQGGLF